MQAIDRSISRGPGGALRLALVLAAFFLTSCAAMFTGTKSTLMIDSEPRGIPFTIGELEGVTPQSVTIPKKEKTVVFSPPGQAPVERSLGRRFQGGFLLMDILFTPGYGLVGILIDGGTGAWYKHDVSVFLDLAHGPVPGVQAASAPTSGSLQP
jgi:hypothetical protein